MKKKILIAGGSGLVGGRLIELLDSSKYTIHVLSRKEKVTENIHYFKWDFETMSIDENAVRVDYIINLNGAGIADKRWTPSRKKLLIESRTKSAKLIKTALERIGHKPKFYISASAIGFYGNRMDEQLDETSAVGNGFMAECCKKWEAAAMELEPLVNHLLINRIGIVLSSKGGALPKILMTRSIGVYNYFGDGAQYYSWIHIDDLCQIFINQIENSYPSGVYNAVSPNPMTNKQFTIEIKNVLKGIVAMPAPVFGLRLILGEMADVVLNSNLVHPRRLKKQSFEFKFSNLGFAVEDLLKRKI